MKGLILKDTYCSSVILMLLFSFSVIITVLVMGHLSMAFEIFDPTILVSYNALMYFFFLGYGLFAISSSHSSVDSERFILTLPVSRKMWFLQSQLEFIGCIVGFRRCELLGLCHFFPLIILMMICISDVSDIKCKWRRYCDILPVKPETAVLAKYADLPLLIHKNIMNSLDLAVTVFMMLANSLFGAGVYCIISLCSEISIPYGIFVNVPLSIWFLISGAISRIEHTVMISVVFLIISIVFYIISLSASMKIYKSGEHRGESNERFNLKRFIYDMEIL